MSSVELITLDAERLADLLAEAAERGARRVLVGLERRPAEKPPTLYTVAEAAAILKCAPVTLQRRVRDGRLIPVTRHPMRIDLEAAKESLRESA